MSLHILSVLITIVGLVTAINPPPSCPPPGLQAKLPFSLREYISSEWYIIEQMPVAYQKPNTLYCVRANYTLTETPGFFPSSTKKILVENYSNKNRVNGKVGGGPLCGLVMNPLEPSKIKVGPTFLLPFSGLLYGPYWVIEAGRYDSILNNPEALSFNDSTYEWALISGGPPKRYGLGGFCRTGSGINNSGFWIFARSPTPPPGVTDAIKKLAKRKGYDTSVLRIVEQSGCLYNEA